MFVRRILATVTGASLCAGLCVSCSKPKEQAGAGGAGTAGKASADHGSVVVYTALDRMFSEPILQKFENRTGIKVAPKYDTESTKTIGLVNAIRAEKTRPRCDVFWNNEIVNTLRLKDEGLLASYKPKAAEAYPETFRDPEGFWNGFAARARVLLVNTNVVTPEQMPNSIYDLGDSQWKGKTGIAKPLFGTTATHAVCMFSFFGADKAKNFFAGLKQNDIQIQAGNKTVAQSVSAGRLAFGITDTDDAIIEVESGKPVEIVFPDGATEQHGVLFIPNTLAIVKNCPNPENARKLVEYLLGPDVETALAKAASAQIPLNPNVTVETRVSTPQDVKTMDVDFNDAAQRFDEAANYIKDEFLR